MTATITCPCGAGSISPGPGKSIRCLNCGRILHEPAGVPEDPVRFIDAESAPAEEGPHWSQRMFAALLDPRSIHWMLGIGGGLMVVGLVVWLVSQGIFENVLVVAGTLTAGSLLIHAAGCGTALKTRYKTVGHALAFLGCLLLPLNLWFYHAQGLLTLDGKLWVGGVVCSATYIATVFLLRSPLFMFAVEGGITLTVLLLLGEQGVVADATWLSIVLAGLAFISIHAERAFPIDGEFDRKRFGLPLFWSGHAQLAAAIGTLLGSQLLALVAPKLAWLGFTWQGNWLTQHAGAAAALWLVGGYLYVYSDLAVRRVGWYIYAAAACFVGAELTLIGHFLPVEWMIAAPAITAIVLTFLATAGKTEDYIGRRLTPLAVFLATVSVLAGLTQHVTATSEWVRQVGWQTETGWAFLGTLILVAACNRVMAVLQAARSRWAADTHLFLSSAAVLIGVAGLLRCLHIESWTQQAPLVMLVPLAYLVAARLWQDKEPARPLAIAAHVGAGVILLHVLFNTIDTAGAYFMPRTGSIENVWLGLTFIEAAIFYLLFAILFKQEGNIYAATAAACAAVWQGAVYYNLPDPWYTMLFAGLGLVALATTRMLDFGSAAEDGQKKGVRSLKAAFESAHALISLAFLSGLMQGLARLATRNADWPLLSALGLTTLAGLVAIVIAPSATWRRIYAAWSIALAAVSFLTLNVLIDLNIWQKTEIFAIALGALLLLIGYIGRFLERTREESDHVTLALVFGSILPTAALLIAVLYHRFVAGQISLPDEFGLAAVAVFLLVTGFAWQLKMPTVFGGGSLAIYLLVLIGTLAYFPNAAIGVYLAIGGGLLFAAGVLLSIFRERLAKLPQQISEREGVFQVLSWR